MRRLCVVIAAYIYWRMLSRNPEATRKIVFATKPAMNAETDTMDNQTLSVLIGKAMHTVSVTYDGCLFA